MPDSRLIESVSLSAGVAHLLEPMRYLADAKIVVSVQIKDDPHNFRLRFIDGKNAILFVVAVELVIAQHPTVFDGLSEAKFGSLGQLTDLILSNTSHNREPKLTV